MTLWRAKDFSGLYIGTAARGVIVILAPYPKPPVKIFWAAPTKPPNEGDSWGRSRAIIAACCLR